MNERARALAILHEARELVAQRLTERILDAEETILDDARGESYMGEIDSLYEQVGMRMVHLSQMISHLPVESDPAAGPSGAAPAPEAAAVPSGAAADEGAFGADALPALLGPVYVPAPALPAPGMRAGESRLPDPTATLQAFVAQVYADDLELAGRSLSALFGMNEGRGQRCAAHFAKRLRQDPQFFRRALRLRDELDAGGEHGALAALQQCFGLAGLDAIRVLSFLRRRLAN
jgi:hypothetical protein